MYLVRNDNYGGTGEMLGPIEMKVIVASKLSKRKLYSHSEQGTDWEFQVQILKDYQIKTKGKLTQTQVFLCSNAILIYLWEVMVMYYHNF